MKHSAKGSPKIPKKKPPSIRFPAPSASPGRGLWLRRLVAAFSVFLLVGVAQALVTLPPASAVAELVRQHPRSTALIDARAAEARASGQQPHRAQAWVPMSDVAPELIASIVASEDARFFVHEGVDVAQLKLALKQDLATGHWARGASTLTQQLAKNLWLSERKTPLRKLQELVMAHRLEEELTKERILELYVNEVEWGDGIYGCEAASRAYFGHRCRDLSLAEAAQLAAMLPAPRQLQPPGHAEALRSRALHVLQRVEDEHLARPDAVVRAREQVERPSHPEVAALSPGA